MKHCYCGEYDAKRSYKRGDVVRTASGRYHVFSHRGFIDVAAPRDVSCIGPQGPQGLPGESIIGPQGERGVPGESIMGPQGAQGPRGQRGPRGRDGMVATYTRVAHTHDPSGVPVQAIFDSTAGKGYVVFISGNGHVDLAQANGEPQALAVGVVIDDIVQPGSFGRYVTTGIVAGFTDLTPGAVYYLDPNVAGRVTATYPTTAGHFVVIVGTAASETELNVRIHWANYIQA